VGNETVGTGDGAQRWLFDALSAVQRSAGLFPYERYGLRLAELGRRYRAAEPVPHLGFHHFLDPALARELAGQVPNHANAHRVRYRHVNENKASTDRWEDFPPLVAAVLQELNSPRFVALLRALTGIPDLVADPDVEGGGMHQAWAGGFLNVHTDFTVHRRRPDWRRRCNLIVYLSDEWDPAWGGSLEFWAHDMSRCVERLSCALNHAVVFDTPDARHGFPGPLRCPEGRSRKSLQLYYYTVEPTAAVPRPTTYFVRPSDTVLQRVLVRMDNGLLRLYSSLKRRLGMSDAGVSRLMRRVDRGRARRR
jgi:Rps23 Pro-64 3,4-dihydroxylase Tpa1-like proline 4-hydroxylase